MSFPETDPFWLDPLKFIQTHKKEEDKVIAPVPFASKLPGVYSYASVYPQRNQVQWLVVNKGCLAELDYQYLQEFTKEGIPVFANEVFVIFSKHNLPQVDPKSVHLQAFREQEKAIRNKYWQTQIRKQLNFVVGVQTKLARFIKREARIESQRIPKTTEGGQPNLDFWNQQVLFSSEAMRLNIKTLGYEYARSLRSKLEIPQNLQPQKVGLTSKVCQQEDIESAWFLYWCQELQVPVVYHRKLWEFCYILQVLWEHDLLQPGRKGLGFGCGEEPLPSLLAAYDIAITATDLDPQVSTALGWVETNQSMTSVDKIWNSDLCSKELFDKNMSLEYVDMNAIPTKLSGQYDFCWSACALEHLGSIEKGLNFIENSLNTLVPGGVSVHTTELNYLEDEETIDNWGTVLFRKKDFRQLVKKLTTAGHEVVPLDFSIGSGFLDRFIDLPPYDSQIHQQQQEAHLRLLVDGFASTSFGIIIKKAA